MLTADSLRHLAVFSVERDYALVRVLPNAVHVGYLALSSDDKCVAVIGPNPSTISVFECASLNESSRLSLGPNESDRAVRIAFTPSPGDLLCATVSNKLIKFDSKSGRVLSTINNIHRSFTDFVGVTNDGHYLVTSGDNLIKVWDYQMRYDHNFQVRG